MMADGQNHQVLIIEDDPDARSNLVDILELDDWSVETAGTAREAFQRDNWAQLAAVLVDRKLPDASGTDLIPKLRVLAPQASVIIITGFADLDSALSALRQGAADYILKPINPEALRASLNRIAERQRAAADLRESNQRLQAVFENALDGILIANDQGMLRDVNPAACTILRMSRSELLQRSMEEFIKRRKNCTFEEHWREFLAAGTQSGKDAMVRHDGREIEVDYQAVANFLPGLHLISIRDITERRLAEHRARQAERLAAIGETMAGLVHEGRNALQRSKACLEMLALEVEDRPSALDLVARIQRAQDDLHRLYEEVRQYAAPLALNRQLCDLRAVWRETWAHLSHTHQERDLQLDEEFEGDAACEIDPFTVDQVFRNIFENAIQVSPPEGRITIVCQPTIYEGQDAICCSIRDSGPGMNAEQRGRIFEPFFTTKSKGTGLGMAIAQRIVESHGGRIEVADRDGPGAEIVFTLPKKAAR